MQNSILFPSSLDDFVNDEFQFIPSSDSIKIVESVVSLPPVATNLLFPYAILKYPFDLLPSNLICDQSLLFFE